jgi:hypothetical protein
LIEIWRWMEAMTGTLISRVGTRSACRSTVPARIPVWLEHPCGLLASVIAVSEPSRQADKVDEVQIADVATEPDFAVRSVHRASDHVRWSVPEEPLDPGIVLVTRGRFQRRSQGVGIDVDTTMGYLRHPGAEESFARPGRSRSPLRQAFSGGET